jgi:CheY-like chemotaxis protein
MAVILVVDDEPDVRLVARVVLTSAGYEVLEASSGEEALAQLAIEPRPDAMLLDIRMKGSDTGKPELPVVVFTAHLSARQDAPRPWRNYEHFLTKPFEPDALLEAVKNAIGSPDESV